MGLSSLKLFTLRSFPNLFSRLTDYSDCKGLVVNLPSNKIVYQSLIACTNVLIMCTNVMFCCTLQVKIGQSIGVTLDMDLKTLSFDLDGQYLGVAFTMLPPCQLFPAVSAVYGNSEISLVYCGLPLVG